MGISLDAIPLSAIVRIRDLMYKVDRPFRLDQGDVSFDAPDSFKQGVREALDRNHTHYLPTIGVPRLRELLSNKLRQKNGIPVESADEVHVTNGGTHAMYVAMQALLEPGDEVIVPDPEWPPTMAIVRAAQATPVAVPLHESLGWRWDLDALERAITPKTRAIYINSPNNPTGGMLTRADLERIAAIATERNLWVFSDEAYEDVVFRGDHISMASLPGMHARTISLYTFSKSYAVTGVRMGYYVIHDPEIRARALKVLMYTTSNVSSLVQYGAIGALEGPQDCITAFRDELQARRDLFFEGIASAAPGILTGTPPDAAFYAFLRINPDWARDAGITGESLSWAMAEHLIRGARIGCVPGVDFGAASEGYLRFCTCRSREELTGALASMKALLTGPPQG
jgi:aspartate/methionine/tyrosine aminotransferase